ncbi:MAG: sigma-54-dependent Fis family transcriptional regulator [Acidobacteria bacterium]|nr:sigma-54-dependent Fis family transcriptional regulator [Acidobacteriota bacterium]
MSGTTPDLAGTDRVRYSVDIGERLIGRSPAVQALEQEVECAARSDAKVLITGESGVGKEILARLIHRRSPRTHAQLLTINCAGLPDSLLESELFGHVRGAFTGAYRDKVGLLEMAHRGTILMDEVGEMSLRMQALLLRFLESGEIQRVGSDRPQTRVDVRVIAATNRNLIERIASREFREDLYYRLNVIHLTVPPLRERREDIPDLLDYFFKAYAERHGVPPLVVTPEALSRLIAYHWGGNVRELKNFVERLVLKTRTGIITPEDLPSELTPFQAALPLRVVRCEVVHAMFDRMVTAHESFWTVVYEPFMLRDLTRDDLRAIISSGLEQTRGSYRILVNLFGMAPGDYKRFLNFLRKHDCQIPFQRFRNVPGRLDELVADGATDAVANGLKNGRAPARPAGGSGERNSP